MAAQRPSPAPRRPRHGSLERPISGRTYRGTALLVAIPLLIAAFSVGRPDELPPATLPPAFDQQGAVEAARELALQYPRRPARSVRGVDPRARFRAAPERVRRRARPVAGDARRDGAP